MPVYTAVALVMIYAVVVAEVPRHFVASCSCVAATHACYAPAFICIFAGCVCQVDRACNVLEFHEKPPRTQLATMSIDTLEYGFGEGQPYAAQQPAREPGAIKKYTRQCPTI
jgi:hypothetical protein